ncbi:saccharopine dehydrogenase NADP-binding domain-containing protein [Variovorax sp. J22P271]|uniref:saccharopine dehydrogenase family protein n=1 Tax=Variovorax davisae TaxID=3053515 RepID=UPI0025754E9C|nr:saccharopine dehydrogenase NADP-binding domain-containing protein [Variovorax sp. J22P271]MDM0036146.1 saccharopine dehydrogenase NADP-binding domain-containing protein [Variovorax sp. J22P271]
MISIRNVLVLGAGKVGGTVADMLADYHRMPVTLADREPPRHALDDRLVRRTVLDVEDDTALAAALAGHQLLINALPFQQAGRVAAAARRLGVHYLDLTEDVAATRAIRGLADGAATVLMPQCGLAPGVIGMLGAHLASRFDDLHDLHLRVGALSRHATNGLRYNFTWSIDGLINEYCHPCAAIVQGQPVSAQPLEGLETLVLDGDTYEAFNTSGGLGTLCETLAGRVRNLDYKTLRYPGHRDAMALLLHDLRLAERRDLLRQVLEYAVPHSREDVVIVFASASGLRGGRLEQETRMARIQGGRLRGVDRTAIELATAAGVVGVFELLRTGRLPARGFVGQERVALDDFLATRVGACYAALREPGAGAAPAGPHRGATFAHTWPPQARRRARKEPQA